MVQCTKIMESQKRLMYESSIDQGKAMFQPLTDFLTFERTAAEILFRRNLGYTTEIFLANVRHLGALGTTLNPAALFGAQAAFVNDLGQRFFETATELLDQGPKGQNTQKTQFTRIDGAVAARRLHAELRGHQ